MTRAARVVFAIARADLRERTRRYAFLVALGFVCWLGFLTSNGTVRVELGRWRGVPNSAWIGSSLAVVASTFLSLLGYWLVRGTIERDRVTGVGDILAATPLTRSTYLLGKWVSHFAYLSALTVLLALAALAMAARNVEGGLDVGELWLPFAFIALPGLAFVAGLAVAFDVLPLLKSGLGSMAWIFGWTMLFTLSLMHAPALDFSGMAATRASMRAQLLASEGVDETGFRVGGGPRRAMDTFTWDGVPWTATFLLSRALWVGAGALAALLVTPFFDRFDPSSARRLSPGKGGRAPATARPGEDLPAASPRQSTSPARGTGSVLALPPAPRGRAFVSRVSTQLRLALRGQRYVFWLGGAALAVAGFFAAPGQAPPLALAFVWPVLVWARLGAPDPAVAPVLAACPRPVWRPLLAAFAAGALVAAVLAAGPAFRGALASERLRPEGTFFATVLFPPALALALGAWARTPRLFEAVYTALWYVAIQTPPLDFLGATPEPNPLPFLAAVPVLLVAAGLGRTRREG